MVTTQIDLQMSIMKPKDWESRQHFTPETYIRDKERGVEIGNMIAAAPMKAMHQYIKEFALTDLTKELAQAKVPTLFIGPFYNYEDETFRVDREVRWFDMLADAPPDLVKVVFFYDSSSWVTEDQPEYLDEAVRAFLAGEEVVGSPEFNPFKNEDGEASDDQ
jgi:pimeloyl-ACP methyl ester carboxylesterase